MRFIDKIKKYGIPRSVSILFEKLLCIRIMKFHYLKLVIDYEKAKKHCQPISSEVVKLEFNHFLTGDKSVFTNKKLELIKKRLNDDSYKAYGIIKNGVLVYSTWISMSNMGLPVKSNYILNQDEGLLEDSYCHPSERGKGLHSSMNFYRLMKLYELGKTISLAIVLDGNSPAYKVQMKSGFKDAGVFYAGIIFGIPFSTLNKRKYDNR